MDVWVLLKGSLREKGGDTEVGDAGPGGEARWGVGSAVCFPLALRPCSVLWGQESRQLG